MMGNCQVDAMMQLYRRYVAVRTGDLLTYIPSYENLSDAARSQIAEADVIVEQVLDLKPKTESEGLAVGVPKVPIPMVTAAFLWPFGGQEHPYNQRPTYFPTGPYGAEAGDSFLNRLIQKGVSPDDALEAYLAVDFTTRINLDRLYELVIDRQRARDRAAGYRIADTIERYFRTEQIFLSSYHPNTRITRLLAEQVFRQLGANRRDIERMQNGTVIAPFPREELPIHPGVARHFGLRYAGPNRRYRLMNEGRFTFDEFVLRYMRTEWNADLEEGIALSRTDDTDTAAAKLAAGLARTPASGAGNNALRVVLEKRGQTAEAIEAGRRAVTADPDWAPYRIALGALLRETGQLDEAESEFRRAQAVDPVDSHVVVLRAHLMVQRGRTDEAFAIVLQGLEQDPYAPGLHRTLAFLFETTGQIEQAAASLRRAVEMAPEDEPWRARLAELLRKLGQEAEARLVEDGVAAEPPSPPRQPNEQDAEVAALVDAARADPTNSHRFHALSVALERRDRLPEAIVAAREAAVLNPDNPHRCAHLGHLISRTGDLPAAEAAFRQAVAIVPDKAAFRTPLSDLLVRQGRMEEGLAEAEAAVAAEPGSAQAHGFLGHVLEMMGQIEAAAESTRLSVVLDPRNAEFAGQLARLERQRGTMARAV
jgi:tetratricopeptide (TPR) repeat protein